MKFQDITTISRAYRDWLMVSKQCFYKGTMSGWFLEVWGHIGQNGGSLSISLHNSICGHSTLHSAPRHSFITHLVHNSTARVFERIDCFGLYTNVSCLMYIQVCNDIIAHFSWKPKAGGLLWKLGEGWWWAGGVVSLNRAIYMQAGLEPWSMKLQLTHAAESVATVTTQRDDVMLAIHRLQRQVGKKSLCENPQTFYLYKHIMLIIS